eukprot:m.9440 g.9440  ORF g.9440 m.9440 type:complete len:284 (+) comp9423_c0_seq1:167-1018(+)
MSQGATIPGTVLLLEVYTQIRSELEPAATTKWLCSILESWSSANIASLLVQLFEESDRFTSHLEQCVPTLLDKLDQQLSTAVIPRCQIQLPLSIDVATKALDQSACQQPSKLRRLCSSRLLGFCMEQHDSANMLRLSQHLQFGTTLELLCELMGSGGTHAALLLLQLTPHTTPFQQCLRMVTAATRYLDADVIVATASCQCYRNLPCDDDAILSGSLECHLTSACLQHQHQLAIALEMGCLPPDLDPPSLMMDLSADAVVRERCLSSPASDTSDDALSLSELP